MELSKSNINDFKSVVVDGARVVFDHVVSKKFWVYKFAKTSWADRVFLGYTIYGFAITVFDDIKRWATRINKYENIMKMDEGEKIFECLLGPIDFENESEDDVIMSDRFDDFLQLINLCSEFREHFQNESTCYRLIKRLVSLDEEIKAASLQADPTLVPLYPMFNEDAIHEPRKNPTTEISVMLYYRKCIASTLVNISKQYKNVPFSIISDIVIMGMNPSVTYGLRRFATRMIAHFALSRENCPNIIRANGLMILQFYVGCFYPHNARERDTIASIVDKIGFSAYQPLVRNLSGEEALLVANEFKTYRKIKIMKQTQYIGDFLFNLYKTNSYVSASLITGFMAFCSNVRGTLPPIFCMGVNFFMALFVPNYQYNMLIHVITESACILYNDPGSVFEQDVSTDFEDVHYDSDIPSADMISFFKDPNSLRDVDNDDN